ncbi:uncharacterized protein DSM5745_04437 [Aspergillus mulundensis]|uniref:Ketoreductase domain-containing protein n=1 Tax=Aspergillus mulundensis TaxID=1810919 RepID=A0A3D8SD68_9EURO|nr:Uncharacterized protein DSM5745_04437 [Aspergillus mulundensis]RDW84111.1 Uncharacterized protein DSM5745_04437 [Aspergillus mulundensis]
MWGKNHFEVEGKSVIVAGGSKGLGRELAIQLTSQGANITILARSPDALESTRTELHKHTKSPTQTITATPLDLTNAPAVQEYITSLSTPPDILFCVAGGVSQQIGFFADITAHDIENCMRLNYLSGAFIAHAVFRRWVKEPPAHQDHTRHLVFTASTAAFLGLPGYAAYAPAKAATRALADTLRSEALLYSSRQEIKIHCSFPGTFYSEGFYEEQKRKPVLLKEIEGTSEDKGGLSAECVAERTMSGLRRGRFLIATDGETELALNAMRGASPRDCVVKDWVMGLVVSLVLPVYRMGWDRRTVKFGERMMGEESG